ncbi:GAF domain-containing protein [Sphingobium sp. WTD-1]|uniref:GAF domain-containing protein n=1 Tax=Sphingobium sp. WTD-1 TaxID=2979467 RepID=UPI0024DE0D1C|nr:GAF domain-containing protein [Sphingobium sp. WTD-1]WIA58260.1 GAF domain-containing protein [Sphingobium sp. WTD-1]
MEDEIVQLYDRVTAAASARARVIRTASRYVKGVLVTVGAFVAGVAQFATWKAGTDPDPAQIIGIAACIVVLIGGIFVMVTEEDATKALDVAQEATKKALVASQQYESYYELEEDFERLIELYQAARIMTTAVEKSTDVAVGGEAKIALDMMELAGRSLSIAAGFQQNDRWTICIYQYIENGDGGLLKCVAQRRAIECNIETARTWPTGSGAAGMAYTRGKEVIIPDMQAPEMRPILNTDGQDRPSDDDRYKSMVVMPITVRGRKNAWGVVTATNDRTEHFSYAEQSGIKPEEPIRLLTEFMSLAISLRDAHMRRTANQLPAVKA